MTKKKTPKKKKTAKKKTKQGHSNSAPVKSLPSLPSMEGLLAGIGGDVGRGSRSAVDEAQEIMYDAWEAPTRQRAVALAKKALEVSPDCADAYNLLAEETAKSLEEALELYRKGGRGWRTRARQEDVQGRCRLLLGSVGDATLHAGPLRFSAEPLGG